MVLQGKCGIPSQFPGATPGFEERRAIGMEPQGEEKLIISQKNSEETRLMESWGYWEGVLGHYGRTRACAPALFHEEQRDHLQEGWFPRGKPNWGPSSIS